MEKIFKKQEQSIICRIFTFIRDFTTFERNKFKYKLLYINNVGY